MNPPTRPALTAALWFAAAATGWATPAAYADVAVNDSFLDGSAADTGQEWREAAFFTTSSSAGLEASRGSLGLVSGSSGRAIHTVFPTQRLSAIGDNITATFLFTTPATVGTDENNGLRIGLFDTGGRQLAAAIESSTSRPNPLLGDPADPAGAPGLAGFSADYDVNDRQGGTRDDEVVLRQSLLGDPSGRLLTTTSGFADLDRADALDASNGFTPNTRFTGVLSVTRVSLREVEVSTSLSSGGTVRSAVTATATADSFEFGLLGFAVSSDAFGSSNRRGEPDNGLDFSSVMVETTLVPEPG